MKWYIKVLKQYADFNGRARRQEYWMFILIHLLIFFGLGFILGDLSVVLDFPELEYLFFGYFLATIIPTLAVVVRRLHDSGKSGWMILVKFVPFIGGIWLIVLLATEGDRCENLYGKDPKNVFDEIDEIGQN